MVGAGPSGSCLGFFLAKEGHKVLLLEKKTFPRDKYCGDAVCKTGIEILHEMELFHELVDNNKAHVVSYNFEVLCCSRLANDVCRLIVEDCVVLEV